MRQHLLDAAFECIRRATCGDEDAIGNVPLFVPGFDGAALGGNLIAAYFLAQVDEIGIGVEEGRPRAFALIRRVCDQGGLA